MTKTGSTNGGRGRYFAIAALLVVVLQIVCLAAGAMGPFPIYEVVPFLVLVGFTIFASRRRSRSWLLLALSAFITGIVALIEGVVYAETAYKLGLVPLLERLLVSDGMWLIAALLVAQVLFVLGMVILASESRRASTTAA